MKKACFVASLLAGVIQPLSAQTPPGGPAVEAPAQGALQDIVVTAQKRAENVQSVPLAITAVSGNTLAQQHIASIASLVAAVPNVNFGTYGGAARIAIRGVGFDTINPGGEARVAYHLDGVYISRPAATFGTFFDVDRVEVLRGPQGTLYGRNATGGSINVITRQPTDTWQAYVRAGYGNYNAITSEGGIGGPIAPGIRFRIAFTTEDHDGWGKNVVTGHDIDDAHRRGARGALSFDLGSTGKLDLSADYYHEHDRDYGNHYLGQANPAVTPSGFLFGGFAPANVRDIANNFDPSNDRTFYGASARLQFDLGAVTLKSISAYRHSNYFLTTDLDVTSAPLSIFQFFERGRQLSQEFQLSGEAGRLKYIAGVYYFDEKIFGGSAIPLDRALVGLPSLFTQGYRVEGHVRTRAAAAFGQADYALSDTLTATVGARYSWEKHHIDDYEQFDLFRPYPPQLAPSPIFSRSASSVDKAFTPKVELEYKPRRGVMFYVSASKGFKSGGFDVGDPSPAFRPETLWAYEAGVKSTFANGLVRINASTFYYDYKNLQVSKVVNATVMIQNAASSVIYGAEAEITVIPYEGLQFDVAPAWLHSRYKDFSSANPATPAILTPVDLEGNQLTQAPNMAINAGAEYRWAAAGGHISLRGELAFQDRIYFTPFNEKAVSRAPNTKFNAFLNYQGRRIDISIYGRNLTNRTTIANGLVSSAAVGLPVTGTLEAPRTYGIQVGYKF